MVLFFSVVTLDATEVYPWGFLGLGVLARGSYMGCDSEKDLLTQRLRIENGRVVNNSLRCHLGHVRKVRLS